MKRAYHKTTNSHHRFTRHPNLLVKPGPEYKLPPLSQSRSGSPILLYLPLRSGTAYLSSVTDACSRKIVGYHKWGKPATENVVKAFRQASEAGEKRQVRWYITLTEDRGNTVRYFYQSVHERNGITCSMTGGYECHQNALAERINGILKNEFYSRPVQTAQAREIVKSPWQFINPANGHTKALNKTPDDVHQAFYRQKLSTYIRTSHGAYQAHVGSAVVATVLNVSGRIRRLRRPAIN